MEPIVANVWIDDTTVYIQTVDGKVYSEQFYKYPLLRYATPAQRAHFEYDNFGIRWEDIDEDLSYNCFHKHTGRTRKSKTC
ncbi:DUF2442 domain-containing protein [Candidatus Symbiothrix dinenymphae]|uniref:DUF2442 domain-containing protein n=1 Tax=Candidatus Symbiothrix dinenymphae TaxID=467085 RepID=UPI0006BEF18B|nr:DUF2442 domain-containing protein [Candidatus Symbiothrix dinenymphae]GAP73439.1 hypothetical protein SAMD00024442_9_46 [Candidatus Symbiothrix dinenymphae]